MAVARSRHDGELPVGRWFEADYWRGLIPGCAVTHPDQDGGAGANMPSPAELAPTTIAELRRRMDDDGYFDLAAAALEASPQYAALIRRLGAAVQQLVARGWPANFVVVLDEAWQLVRLLSQVVHETTGGNECMMDLVAWHVDPGVGEAGFTPHRDRHLGADDSDTELVAAGFRRPDGRSPRDCTCCECGAARTAFSPQLRVAGLTGSSGMQGWRSVRRRPTTAACTSSHDPPTRPTPSATAAQPPPSPWPGRGAGLARGVYASEREVSISTIGVVRTGFSGPTYLA